MVDIVTQFNIPMSTPTERRIQRVRHELLVRDLEVARIEHTSPHFVAVTLQGDSLASFRSDGFDDHVKLLFGDGTRRDYTPRRFDPERRELTLEFALHGEGAASDWARGAQVGQHLTVAGPRGSMVIPSDYDWHLLIGDATALPAVHRRLEELPVGVQALVVLQVAEADRRPLAGAAPLTLHWVDDAEALLARVAALPLPDGEGFAWAAGEAALMARLRPLLLHKGLPKASLKVAAYWKAGAVAFHETLEG